MIEIDTSSEHRIGRDWIKSIALVVLCLACSALLIWATTLEPTGPNDISFQRGAYLFLPFLLPFTVWVVYRLLVPLGALLWIATDGFADRRASAQIIPWHGIGKIVRKGEFISLTLKRKTLQTCRFSPAQRRLKSRRKTARPSHLLVAQGCLARSGTDVLALFHAFQGAHSGSAATR